MNFFTNNQIEYIPQLITFIYFIIITICISKKQKKVFKEMLLENIAKTTIGFLTYFAVPISFVIGLLHRNRIIDYVDDDKFFIVIKYVLIYPINYGFSLVLIAISISAVGKKYIKDMNDKLLKWDHIILCFVAWIICGVFFFDKEFWCFWICTILAAIFYLSSLCRLCQHKFPNLVPKKIKTKMDYVSEHPDKYRIDKS